jgi:hypothetical protein
MRGISIVEPPYERQRRDMMRYTRKPTLIEPTRFACPQCNGVRRVALVLEPVWDAGAVRKCVTLSGCAHRVHVLDGREPVACDHVRGHKR